VSFAAITLCVASQRVFIVVVDFLMDSVRKLLDTSSYFDSLRVRFCFYKREILTAQSFDCKQ
jgi:hypothetical protein